MNYLNVQQRDKVQIELRERDALERIKALEWVESVDSVSTRDLELKADTLSNSNESLRKELGSALARIQELEGKTASDAHGIDKAGTISKTDSDTTQLPIESISQEKSAKARALELHDEYPNMTQREIIDQLFDEGFKAKSGKRLGSGSISKWLKKS